MVFRVFTVVETEELFDFVDDGGGCGFLVFFFVFGVGVVFYFDGNAGWDSEEHDEKYCV